MRKSALRPALAVIAAVVATAMSAPSAYAVHYKVRITGAGRVYDHLEQKRLDCSSPISTPQGQLGRDCDTVDYPNAWSITFTPDPPDGWEFEGWQGTSFGIVGAGPLHCDHADESHWLPATKLPDRPYPAICTFGTNVFGDALWGLEARFTDVRDPETTITEGTEGRTGPDDRVSWSFTEPENLAEGSSFECQFNSGAWTACTSGQSYPNSQFPKLDNTFSVRAKDPSGRVDGSPESKTWHIDREAPSTTIDTGPSSPSTSHTASFTFSITHETGDHGGSIQCKLDAGDWGNCADGASGNATRTVGEGAHTFYARGVDQYGNTDQTPAEWKWVVDTGPPDTSITSGPAPGTRTALSGATFGFTSEPGAHFECQLEGGGFTLCSGPGNFHTMSELSDGSHTFAVRAIDAVGNVDGTPATRTWTVDTIAPDTAITSGPAEGGTLYATSASVTFASEPGASFECRVDAAPFGACSDVGSHTAGGLTPGPHSIQVRAVDDVGNRDGSPATRTFTIALPTLSVSNATVTNVRWRQSTLRRAVLRLRGSLSGASPGELRVALNGGTLTGSVPPGAFDTTLPLPASIRAGTLPGANSLTLGGTSSGLPIPGTTHSVRVPAPAEGVVTLAKISTSKRGQGLTRISSAKKLWATFRFAPDAKPKKAIRAYWSRNGKRLGSFPAAAPKAFSWYRRAAGLQKGKYACALKMGKTVIKRVAVRVG